MGVVCGPWTAARPTRGLTTGVGLLLAVGTAGCTMCPDPFDYSGPVPNGSVTQNDFGARSNGILPLLATPSPWPTVVEQEAEESVLRVAEVPDSPECPELPDPSAIVEVERGEEGTPVQIGEDTPRKSEPEITDPEPSEVR